MPLVQRARVQSLVGELGSYKPHNQAKTATDEYEKVCLTISYMTEEPKRGSDSPLDAMYV